MGLINKDSGECDIYIFLMSLCHTFVEQQKSYFTSSDLSVNETRELLLIELNFDVQNLHQFEIRLYIVITPLFHSIIDRLR